MLIRFLASLGLAMVVFPGALGFAKIERAVRLFL